MKLLASSVARGDILDGCPAGLFLIDLEAQSVQQVLDYNPAEIDTRGREKGLRGIAFDKDSVFVVAGNELFAYTPAFELINRWQNPYLERCGGIAIHERKLFITSGGFDSIVGFDLDKHEFDFALHLLSQASVFGARRFDPNADDGPIMLGKLDLRSVYCDTTGMYICIEGGLLRFTSKIVSMAVELPPGSHDAQPFRDGVLFNDSLAGTLRYSGRGEGEEDRAMFVPERRYSELQHEDQCNDELAQAGFARGLCALDDRIVAGGSSPATISVYDLAGNKTLLSVRLSNDARSAIHSVRAWPFD